MGSDECRGALTSAAGPLAGRTVLITGAGGRVGAALARGFAHAGATLVLTGRRPEPLAALTGELGELGERIGGTHLADLAQAEEIERLFHEVADAHGRLDVLVNNAGRASAQTLGEVTSAEFLGVLALNVVAPLLCAQQALALFPAPGGGKILNVGSIYGSVAVDPHLYAGAPEMIQGSPAYVASKSALVNLTRDLAVRLAPRNVQVNMLSPGGVEAGQPPPFQAAYRERTPAGRMAQAGDLIGAAVFLCSSAADYVTGQNLHVDGGFTAW